MLGGDDAEEQVSSVSLAALQTNDVYHHFLPVQINGVNCAALVDSGNTWRNVMSWTFARRLGIRKSDLESLETTTTVKTAQEGGQLQIIGQLKKPLTMCLPKTRDVGDSPKACLYTAFKIRPVVVANLTMALNLSGPFLKYNKIDQLHSKNCLRLQNGQLVPLMTSKQDLTPEVSSVEVRVRRTVRLQPMSVSHVSVILPKLRDEKTVDGMIEGHNETFLNNGVFPWSAAVITSKEGCAKAGLINATTRTIKIKAGTRYGRFTRLCALQQQHIFPGRVAAVAVGPDGRDDFFVQSVSGVTNKPTVRSKLRQIMEKLQQTAKQQQQKQEPPPQTREQKLKWLFKSFRVADSPILKNNRKQQDRLCELLLKYFDTVSVNGEYGCTDLIEHEINTQDTAPIRCKTRVINPMLEGDLKRQLNDNLKRGVIEPSNSPWSFPLVAAPKKNNTIRWCVDYRKLNFFTVRDAFSLPNIDDNLARLSNAEIFSTLDGSGAFHVIPIKESDRPKTAFSTPYGLYQYTRMPFGLCNGPASYSRLIQLALTGIPLTVALPYLDDIIIISKDVESHFKNLELILQVHRKAGLKLQPTKCFLFRDKVAYLGHQVSKQGIEPIPDSVKDVKYWPIPQSKTELKTFLGKTGYYRRFIKGYSAIAYPLYTQLSKNPEDEDKQSILISPAFRKAFDILKQRLITAPILAYPRFDSPEPFILDTDWSAVNNAIGGVLSQVQDGKERVIAYGGKKMSKAQANYSPFKGELAALLHFAKVWRYFLQFRPFILRIDHAPLTYLESMEPQDRHTLRMLSTLANLKFTIKHRRGASHSNADSLSRAPHIANQPFSQVDVGADDDDFLAGVMTATVQDLQAIAADGY